MTDLRCPDCGSDDVTLFEQEPDETTAYCECNVCSRFGTAFEFQPFDVKNLPPALPWEHHHNIQYVDSSLRAGITFSRETFNMRDGGQIRHIITNVPRYIDDSTGFEWGYNGSGPTRLAMNILEAVLREEKYTGIRAQVEEQLGHAWRGGCYYIVLRLRHDFKERFIAPAPKTGEVLDYEEVRTWINERIAAIANV